MIHNSEIIQSPGFIESTQETSPPSGCCSSTKSKLQRPLGRKTRSSCGGSAGGSGSVRVAKGKGIEPEAGRRHWARSEGHTSMSNQDVSRKRKGKKNKTNQFFVVPSRESVGGTTSPASVQWDESKGEVRWGDGERWKSPELHGNVSHVFILLSLLSL